MKIAACFSGQLRFFEKSYSFFKDNLLSRFSVDVFIHTWYDPALENKHFEYSHSKKPQGAYSIQDIDRCILLYAPKAIMIDQPITFKPHNKGSRENNACSMFYSVHMSNLLKKKNESISQQKYDWVLRLRFDWAYTSFINLSLLNSDYVYIPDRDKTTTNPNHMHLNDQFAIGSSANMDVYSDAFLFTSNVSSQGNEDILYEILTSKNIVTKDMNWTHCFPPNDLLGMSSFNSLFRE